MGGGGGGYRHFKAGDHMCINDRAIAEKSFHMISVIILHFSNSAINRMQKFVLPGFHLVTAMISNFHGN